MPLGWLVQRHHEIYRPLLIVFLIEYRRGSPWQSIVDIVHATMSLVVMSLADTT